MLRQALSSALLRAGACRPALLPTLGRVQTRTYGFGSHVSDNDPEVMEREKQRHLQGKTISHIKQVPGWNERLASDAEAIVKAEHDCPDCPIDEMQKQTIETLQEEGEQDMLPTQSEPKSGAMGAA